MPFQNSQPLLAKINSQNTSKAHNAESMEANKLNKDGPANTKAEWRLSLRPTASPEAIYKKAFSWLLDYTGSD